MKFSFNRKVVNGSWGGGNLFVKSMSEYLISMGHRVSFDLEDNIDIIFLIDPKSVDSTFGYSVEDIIDYGEKNPDTKIVHRINECDLRKGTNFIDSLLLQVNPIVDHTIFISRWLADYFLERGFDREYSIVYNGCDSSHFYPKKFVEIDKSEPVKIVTHHWSDNWMKGFDIYKAIDHLNRTDIEFTYIGRYNNQYQPSNTNLISPISGKILGDELRKHDLYVTASRFEPCGMHHIEGSSSGLPVLYHRDGGGINELCVNHGVEFFDIDTFLSGLLRIVDNYREYVESIDYDYLSSHRMCAEYYKEIMSNVM